MQMDDSDRPVGKVMSSAHQLQVALSHAWSKAHRMYPQNIRDQDKVAQGPERNSRHESGTVGVQPNLLYGRDEGRRDQNPGWGLDVLYS